MKAPIFLILLTTRIYTTTYADKKLIESTCKNTPNYRVCIVTLRSNPASATADVAGLALIIVKAMKSKFGDALSTINTFTKSGKPNLISALHRCSEIYNIAQTDELSTAVEAITKGDPKFAISAMQDVMGDVDACNRGFKGGVAPSPLGGQNKLIADLAGINIAIIRSLF